MTELLTLTASLPAILVAATPRRAGRNGTIQLNVFLISIWPLHMGSTLLSMLRSGTQLFRF